MGFKMNTHIGAIHAKTEGTKAHAKAKAEAHAIAQAKGNIQGVSNPLNLGSPLKDRNSDAKKANERKQVENVGDDFFSNPNEVESDNKKESNRKKQSATNTANRKAGKKVSYNSAYADADMKKYGGKDGKAKFIKDAKAYNAKKNKSKNSVNESKSTTTTKNYFEKDLTEGLGEKDLTKVKNPETNISNALDTKYKKKTLTAYERMQAKQKELDKKSSNKSETPKSEGPKSKRELRLAKVKNKVKVARKKIDSKGAGDTSEDTKIQQSKSKRLRKKAQRIQGRMDRKAIRKGKGTKEEKKEDISTSRAEQRNKRKEVNSEPKNNLIGIRRGVAK